MKNLEGAVVAVTGCASGIGRALAVNLVKEGCHVAISDIDKAGLKETAELVDPTFRIPRFKLSYFCIAPSRR